VAALKARVVLIRDVPPGSTVGYGATHAARSWERWGTLSIGYGDGLPRALGNRGSALVRGSRVPVIGRISMDMTVVDLSSVRDAVVGDVATLIGTDGGHTITLDEVAAQAGTIGYEILTGLTARLPRVET
jgi:alanine racemase